MNEGVRVYVERAVEEQVLLAEATVRLNAARDEFTEAQEAYQSAVQTAQVALEDLQRAIAASVKGETINPTQADETGGRL